MYYSEDEARKLVIEAGQRLSSEGLVARTWGNISARIDKDKFVITPSGVGYDVLKGEDLVVVTFAADCRSGKSAAGIEDGLGKCTYDKSGRKPSSEKGIHASCYALHSDVSFVIHTHQHYASVIAAEGRTVPFAPCAFYALPGTKALRESVAMFVKACPGAREFLMARHGALVLGNSYEDAFERASKLEELSKKLYDERVLKLAGDEKAAKKLASRKKKAWLDDYAQIVGFSRKIKDDISAEDKEAILMITAKNDDAAAYVSDDTKPLGLLDKTVQRLVYKISYSKKKNG